MNKWGYGQVARCEPGTMTAGRYEGNEGQYREEEALSNMAEAELCPT